MRPASTTLPRRSARPPPDSPGRRRPDGPEQRECPHLLHGENQEEEADHHDADYYEVSPTEDAEGLEIDPTPGILEINSV